MNRFFEPDPLSRAFENKKPPTLLYITKQQFGGEKHDRPMHSHDSFCELLLVYRGFGSYAIRNHSFPIQEGDILFYNQDESHEVRSISNTEIGTYCFAFFGLKFEALPVNHIIPADSHPIRSSGMQFEFLQQLCECAYQRLDTDAAGKGLAQSLALAFLLIARELDEASFIHPGSENDVKMADRIRRCLALHYPAEIFADLPMIVHKKVPCFFVHFIILFFHSRFKRRRTPPHMCIANPDQNFTQLKASESRLLACSTIIQAIFLKSDLNSRLAATPARRRAGAE